MVEPRTVIIGECWARDGLQNERLIVPTKLKVEMIDALQDAGFKEIEVTSFASPKTLPQFADAEEVLSSIQQKPGVSFRAIVTNLKGMERAVAAKQKGLKVDEIAMVISASEAHNIANVNMTHKENLLQLESMCKMALANGFKILGWVLTSFGCPITGEVPMEKVLWFGHWWLSQGATWVGFGDTTGMANPKQVKRFYSRVREEGFQPDQVIVHFHDTRGSGIANNVAALEEGMIYFDCSVGGIGGQPATGSPLYHYGYAGNTCTEDLVWLFAQMGVKTGIDLNKLMAVGLRAESILGRKLRSNTVRCYAENPG